MSEAGVKQWEHSVAVGQWVIAEPQEGGTVLYTCFEGASPLEPVSLLRRFMQTPWIIEIRLSPWFLRYRLVELVLRKISKEGSMESKRPALLSCLVWMK